MFDQYTFFYSTDDGLPRIFSLQVLISRSHLTSILFRGHGCESNGFQWPASMHHSKDSKDSNFKIIEISSLWVILIPERRLTSGQSLWPAFHVRVSELTPELCPVINPYDLVLLPLSSRSEKCVKWHSSCYSCGRSTITRLHYSFV